MEGSLINYSIWLVWITMWAIDSAAIAVIRVHYRITIPITILLLSLIVIPQTSPYQKKFCTSLMVKVKNPYCTSSCTACYIQGSANTIRKAKNFVLSNVIFSSRRLFDHFGLFEYFIIINDVNSVHTVFIIPYHIFFHETNN